MQCLVVAPACGQRLAPQAAGLRLALWRSAVLVACLLAASRWLMESKHMSSQAACTPWAWSSLARLRYRSCPGCSPDQCRLQSAASGTGTLCDRVTAGQRGREQRIPARWCLWAQRRCCAVGAAARLHADKHAVKAANGHCEPQMAARSDGLEERRGGHGVI